MVNPGSHYVLIFIIFPLPLFGSSFYDTPEKKKGVKQGTCCSSDGGGGGGSRQPLRRWSRAASGRRWPCRSHPSPRRSPRCTATSDMLIRPELHAGPRTWRAICNRDPGYPPSLLSPRSYPDSARYGRGFDVVVLSDLMHSVPDLPGEGVVTAVFMWPCFRG